MKNTITITLTLEEARDVTEALNSRSIRAHNQADDILADESKDGATREKQAKARRMHGNRLHDLSLKVWLRMGL